MFKTLIVQWIEKRDVKADSYRNININSSLFFVFLFFQVSASRVNDRHGWLVQCNEPLQFMSLHIPEENRWSTHNYTYTQILHEK